MNENQETCALCKNEIAGSEDSVVITRKGADGINNASVDRGESINVAAGTKVHKTCRMNYINKKNIERHKKAKLDSAPPVKRSARVSTGPYDSKTDCLFCGNKVVTDKTSADYDDSSFVKTDNFVDKILLNCKSRNDDWAFTVWGRIEYFGGDLHAADCVYHHSCDVHFRTFRDIPMQHRLGPDMPESRKRRKVGRPNNND